MTYPYRTGRRAVMNREQAEAIVEAHPDFIVDAWDAIASERPEQLTELAIEWYRSTALFERHVEDLMDGTTPPPCPFRGCDLDHKQENPQSP